MASTAVREKNPPWEEGSTFRTFFLTVKLSIKRRVVILLDTIAKKEKNNMLLCLHYTKIKLSTIFVHLNRGVIQFLSFG